jgi:hypothetical protein
LPLMIRREWSWTATSKSTGNLALLSGNALADTVIKALAPAVPKQISAGIGNLTVIAFSGTQLPTPLMGSDFAMSALLKPEC